MKHKLAAYFFGRNYSFAFSLNWALMVIAALKQQYWVAGALFVAGIPCVAIGEILYERRTFQINCRVIAANDKKIAENAATISRQMERLKQLMKHRS